MPGCQVLGLAVEVSAGLLLSAIDRGSATSNVWRPRGEQLKSSRLKTRLKNSRITRRSLVGAVHSICLKRHRNEAKKTFSKRGRVSVYSVRFSYMGKLAKPFDRCIERMRY